MATPVSTHAARVTVDHLTVRDFRNLERVECEWPAEGVVLVGRNGHGKTNLLEALHFAHALRSLRGAREQDLVRFGAAGFHLGFSAQGARVATLGVGVEKGTRRKRVMADGVEVARLGEAFAAIPSVAISPRDVELVTGPPALRRRFLDLMLAATSRRYLSALQQYRGALLRRNTVLRERAEAADAEVQAAIWEPALATHGATLWVERLRWVHGLSRAVADRAEAMGEAQRFAMRLQTSLREVGAASTEESIRDVLTGALARGRSDDLRRGLTQHGPHRDELLLLLGGKMARAFGSAGQQRTLAMALRLQEAETLAEHLGREPILLLDDPFAELDRERAARILGLLSARAESQRVLAVPRDDEVPEGFRDLRRWHIEGGVLHVA